METKTTDNTSTASGKMTTQALLTCTYLPTLVGGWLAVSLLMQVSLSTKYSLRRELHCRGPISLSRNGIALIIACTCKLHSTILLNDQLRKYVKRPQVLALAKSICTHVWSIYRCQPACLPGWLAGW